MRGHLAIVAILCVTAAACAGGPLEGTPTQAFGLSSSCVPVSAGADYLVSPTVIAFGLEGAISDLRMVTADGEPASIEQVWASSGVSGGDQLSLPTDGVVLERLATASIDVPADVVLAFRVPGDEPLNVHYVGLEYTYRGRTLTADGSFTLRVEHDC